MMSGLIAATVQIGEWVEYWAGRLCCIVAGHAWSTWSGDPHVLEMRVCERRSCHGRPGSVDLR